MALINFFTNAFYPIIWNDNLMSSVSLSLELLKQGRFFKRSALMQNPQIEYYLEAYMDNPGTQGEIKIFLNNDLSPKAQMQVTNNIPSIFEGLFSIKDLEDGIHTLKILSNVNSGKINIGLVEIYQRIGEG